MHKRTCSVAGCTKSVRSERATMCEGHRQKWRRHGDARQEAVRQSELKPFVKRVENTIKRDSTGKIEAGLKQLKGILEDHARGVVSDYEHGKPMNHYRVQAAHEMLKVFQEVDAITCATTIAALYLLADFDRRRFVSDSGFRFQLVRRFRSLTDMNVGSYWNHQTGKVHRVYKDLPVKATEELGQLLMDGYKTFVALVIRQERVEAKREERVKELLAEGFAANSSENKEI